MSHKITLKDWIAKIWFKIQGNFRYILNITKEGKFKIPEEYHLQYTDSFDNDYTKNWRDGSQWWGVPYHSSFTNQWYDPDQIKLIKDGVQFSAILKDRYFSEINTTIPAAIGLMKSIQGWKYGIFSFTSKLPSGTYLWPALWLTGMYNWPPEIDLLEGYSDNTNDYRNNRTLQSNVHIKETPSINPDGSHTHILPNKVTEEFINYVIWWEKDFIKLYYNGYLVRHITDKIILDGMFEPQVIVIGTAIQKGFNKDNLTSMIVNKIAVYQK